MPLSDYYVGQKIVFKDNIPVAYSLGGLQTNISGSTGTIVDIKTGYYFKDSRTILTVKIGRRMFNVSDHWVDKETTFGGFKGTVKDFWLTDSE